MTEQDLEVIQTALDAGTIVGPFGIQKRLRDLLDEVSLLKAQVESFSMLSARYSIIAEQIMAWEDKGDA